MSGLSKVLIAAAVTFAVPVSTAFAQDDAPVVEGEAGVEAGASVDASGAATEPPVEGTATVSVGGPGVPFAEVINRPYTLGKGRLGVSADILIAHLSVSILGMSASSTSEFLGLGAGYGISDKLELGLTYAFALNEFEIKGPLDIYGKFSLSDSGALAVAASADLELNFANDTSLEVHAGLAVRYKVAPKFAIFTGNPYTLGVAGQHLSLNFEDGGAKTFSIPVGVEIQATPQLFAFAGTNIATILLSDPGPGDRAAFIGSDGLGIPLTVGGFFNVNKSIDVGASFQTDLKNAGDFYVLTLGGRYYM